MSAIDPAIAEAASSDVGRPTIALPWLIVTGRGHEVAATDSFIFARVPVTVDEGVERGPISQAAISYAKRNPGATLRLTADRIVVENYGNELCSFPRPKPSGTFPDPDKLWADLTAEDPVVTFGIDLARLHQLMSALGIDGLSSVKIEVGPDPLKPLRVTSLVDSERIALLMPVRVK